MLMQKYVIPGGSAVSEQNDRELRRIGRGGRYGGVIVGGCANVIATFGERTRQAIPEYVVVVNDKN